MHPTLPSRENGATPADELVGDRIQALAGWIQELDAQLRALAVSSDEKTLKELRAALEAWSKRDPKFEERLTDRVDVLTDRLTTLSSAVNTTAAAHASADGELASLRRELEQETAKLQAALEKRMQGSQADGATVAELQRALGELSTDPVRKRHEKNLAELRRSIDYVGERVDTLAKTVATTAAGLTGREGDVAALRRSLEQTNAQIGELGTVVRDQANRSDGVDVAKELETLTANLRAAEELYGSQLRSLDERLQTQVAALETRVESAAATRSETELELAALERRLDDVATTVETAERNLQSALSESVSDGIEERLVPVNEQLENLAAQLRESETRAEERLERESSRTTDVARRLDDADRRVTDLAESEKRLDASVQEAQAALAAIEEISPGDLDARFEPISAQLGAVTARLEEAERIAAEWPSGQASTAAEVEGMRAAVEGRLDALEEGRDTAAAEAAARAAAAWSEEQAWVREHLDALVQAVAETPTKTDVEEPLTTISARLDELERERVELAAELARAGEATAAEQQALAARIAEVAEPPVPPSQDEELKELLVTFADRIEAMERERAAEKRAEGTRQHEVADLHALLAALETRLASTEQLLEDDRAPEVETRVTALGARLESLEQTVNTPRSAPLAPGDGRLRVDLRALELRLQHVEASARETQQAMLVQLERLAARPEPEAIAEVVSIHGGAET